MSQTMFAIRNDREEVFELPDSFEEVVPGVCWGRPDQIFSPAFWAAQAWYDEGIGVFSQHRLGETLSEEISACILGGYGMPAEHGLAAFHRLKERGLLNPCANQEMSIYEALSEPLNIGLRSVKYRFPNQRSRFLGRALNRLSQEHPPAESDIVFRNWLLTFDGIGPKTASWITRNHLDSDRVAILDIHIFRAGVLAGLFEKDASVSKSYFALEQKFVAFAQGMNVRLAVLDAIIWKQMRFLSELAISALNETDFQQQPELFRLTA